VRGVIKDIGYTSSNVGFDGATCGVLNLIGKQSPNINQGVDRRDPQLQGAGDQGLMFGYACNEAPEFMPAPIYYSHRLVEQQARVRKARRSKLPWLRPDAKSQVTLRYRDGVISGLEAVVLSTQHDPGVSQRAIREGVMEHILRPVLPRHWLDDLPASRVHINPTGRFEIGGPVGDCGLTGRKIIVDSYGGTARHGGGAFSGKDPSKVDRSAAYAARYVAKNIVAAGLADRCGSRSWCGTTSTSGPTASSRCSTSSGRCIGRPPPTGTSAASRSARPTSGRNAMAARKPAARRPSRRSRGSAPTRPGNCARPPASNDPSWPRGIRAGPCSEERCNGDGPCQAWNGG
jgi:hypothetical protein